MEQSQKELKRSVSLPLITKKYKILSEESKKELLSFTADKLINKANKIKEIKIYLNGNFNITDVDNEFIKDIEKEYAEQYLLKMSYFPTKKLIQKLLKIKPIENCVFYLGTETVYINDKTAEKPVIHIYPCQSPNEKNVIKSLNVNNSPNRIINKKMVLKHVESAIKFKKKEKNMEKGIISTIKQNNKFNKNNLIFNREKIDSLLSKAKESIIEAQYFNTKSEEIKVDLSPDYIRNNYIIYKKENEQEPEKRFYDGKGRFINISKSFSTKKNILNDDKYIFPVNSIINLTDQILTEINEPLDTKIEIIITDMNYILDHFPINEFITVGKRKDIEKVGMDTSNYLYKINVNENYEIYEVLKILHSPTTFKLIGLTLNLIYWIVFGSNNNVQIDNNTKQFIYLKILKEIEILVDNITNTKILYEVLLPLLIIMIRIEADVYFSRKFIYLFENKENKKKAMNIINSIITEIYDKHGYMNSFVTIAGKSQELKEKMKNNLLPRFKNKLYATSNYIEQLFSNDTYGLFKKMKEKGPEQEENLNDIELKKNFIAEKKISFFTDFLQKINNNMEKRYLKPIFSIRKNDSYKNILMNSSNINTKRFKTPFVNTIKEDKILNKNKDIIIIKKNSNIDIINNAHDNKDNKNKRFKISSIMNQKSISSNSQIKTTIF